MKFVDLPDNSGTTSLMDLMRRLRNCRHPYEALQIYTAYVRDASPGRAHVVLSTAGLAPGEYRVWRLMGDDGVERVEMRDPWKQMDLPIRAGGVMARIIDVTSPRIVRDVDWNGDPYWADVLGPYRSLIAVPIVSDGLPLNWSLILSRQEDYFTTAQLQESAIRATLVTSLLGSLHVSRELIKANAHIEAELNRMARIQRALLPVPIPVMAGIRVAASYETFGQVGGDLYDFTPVNDDAGRWCIFIGDASGHGPSAAVVATMVQSTLHHCAGGSAGPAELCRVLNQRLCQKSIEGSFVTAFMAFYEPARRRLIYTSAGHPAPLLPPRSGRDARFLDDAGGLPLGIDDGATFDEAAIDLVAGESLLLYTDGISEARAPNGTMFGTDGIASALPDCGNDAESVLNRLRQSLSAHQNGRRPDDDQTAVVIHVHG